MRRVAVSLVAVAVSSLALQAAQPHPLMREYNHAWQLSGQLRADEAIPLLKQIIAKDKTFYRAYGKHSASCATDGACVAPKSQRITRVVLWVAAALVVALLAFPYFAPRVFGWPNGTSAASGAPADRCCVVPAPASADTVVQPTTGPAMAKKPTIDPTREIVFKVAKLGCPLVSGVGCGHMLAPALSQIDGLEGVSRACATSVWKSTDAFFPVSSRICGLSSSGLIA